MKTKLYVGNLSFDASDADLNTVFSEYGEVAEAAVIRNKFSGRSRGFGFVTMATEEGAVAAVNNLNGAELDGRKLTVNEAQDKVDRPEGERRGGFRSGGDRGGFRGGDRGPRREGGFRGGDRGPRREGGFRGGDRGGRRSFGE